MTSRSIITSLVAVASTAVLIAGCGGDDGGGGGGGDGASSPAKSSHASSSDGGSKTVTISNFKFAPASLTVAPGTAVTVTNDDSATHTATADDGHSFDTGDVAQGASGTINVSKAGTYAYHCTIHPFMKATLVVGS